MGTDLVVIDPQPQVLEPKPADGRFSKDDNRRWTGGKKSRLENQEFVDLFGLALADGMTNDELAKTFKVSERSAREYKKDPRVAVAANKRIKERVLEIARKVDSTIAARLERADKMDTDTLLKIRKEYLGGAFREQTEKDDPATINDAISAVEKNPELAAQMADLIASQRSEQPANA